MSYKLNRYNLVTRLADGATLPCKHEAGVDTPLDEHSPTVKEYLAWRALGNTPEPADLDPPPTQDQLDVATAKLYVKLTALKAMTPDQVNTWVTNNVNTLAEAKDAIKTLAIAVSILARRL